MVKDEVIAINKMKVRINLRKTVSTNYNTFRNSLAIGL